MKKSVQEMDEIDALLRMELKALSQRNVLFLGAGGSEGLLDTLTFFDLLNQKLLLIPLIEEGISTQFFNTIIRSSPFTLEEWAGFTNLPSRTIQRYIKEQGTLKPIYTEKVFELYEVWKRGIEVFESEEKLRNWLQSPKFIFDDKRPIDLLSNSIGKDLVIQELNRIEYGLFA